MSSLKFGIDSVNTTARVVEIENFEGGNSVITCRTVTNSEIDGLSTADTTTCTLAIDDSDAIVRIVRPAIIEPALAEQAAHYEAEIALLSRGSDISTNVRPISTAGSRDWLAVSIHKSVTEHNLSDISPQLQSDLGRRCIPRSIALGAGLLYAGEPLSRGLTVVVQTTEKTTSICFLGSKSVIGTARLTKPNFTAPENEIAGWLAELKMIVTYRLSTDLAAFAGGQLPTFLWAGTVGELESLRNFTTIDFAALKPRTLSFSARSAVATITPEWLVALGAALN